MSFRVHVAAHARAIDAAYDRLGAELGHFAWYMGPFTTVRFFP